MIGPLAKLARGGSGKKSNQFEPWEPKHAPSLISATSGGQWCQARVASTKAWTDDSSCQLCLHEVGTLKHRRFCSATMPHGGWPGPTGDAAKGLAKLSIRRTEFALERGIIFPVIIVKPPAVEHSSTWLIQPPDNIPYKARWYIDGSCTNPIWKQARGTGYALVLVDFDGTLLAAGNGSPPNYVVDSGGAELWASCRLCLFSLSPLGSPLIILT